MSQFEEERNPYESPRSGALEIQGGDSVPARKMPRFCVGMFVFSLVACLIRIPILCRNTSLLLSFASSTPGFLFAGFDLVIQWIALFAIVALGLLGNIAMLGRRRWGLTVGWLLVAALLVSLFYFGRYYFDLYSLLPPGTDLTCAPGPRIFGRALLIFGIRAFLLAMYIIALKRFSRWINSLDASRRTPADSANGVPIPPTSI